MPAGDAMVKRRRTLLVAAWAALVAVVLGGRALASEEAPVRVTTRAEPRESTIGSPFRYVMTIEAAQEAEVIVPLLAQRIGDFFIQDFGESPRRIEKGRVVIERWYSLVSYEVGEHLIPGPTVQYRVAGGDLQRIDAPDALVVIDSLLPKAGGAKDIRDVKPPAVVPRDYRPLWWGLAALGGLCGAALLLYRALSGRGRSPAVPQRPAHEIALESLVRLRSARLLEAGRHGQFYVELTAIVRTYLERRFELRAPEMTTEEFLQAAQRNPQIAQAHRASLAQFLNEADLVKFAKYVPALEDAERAYAAARQFVEATRVGEGDARAAA